MSKNIEKDDCEREQPRVKYYVPQYVLSYEVQKNLATFFIGNNAMKAIERWFHSCFRYFYKRPDFSGTNHAECVQEGRGDDAKMRAMCQWQPCGKGGEKRGWEKKRIRRYAHQMVPSKFQSTISKGMPRERRRTTKTNVWGPEAKFEAHLYFVRVLLKILRCAFDVTR